MKHQIHLTDEVGTLNPNCPDCQVMIDYSQYRRAIIERHRRRQLADLALPHDTNDREGGAMSPPEPHRLILTVAAAQYELATVTVLMESISRIVETMGTQGDLSRE